MTRFYAGSIKHFGYSFLNAILTTSLILGPCVGQGAGTPVPDNTQNQTNTSVEAIIPRIEGVDLDTVEIAPDGVAVSLPAPLEKIAQEQANAANAAPAWVKELRSRSVGEYFPPNLDDKSEAWRQGKQRLLTDAQNLHKYFEEQDKSGVYKEFIDKKLSPFVNTLDAKKIAASIRDQRITRPIKEWTVETLVVTEQIAYLGRYPNFVKRTMSLFSGRHLRGASAVAGTLVLSAVGLFTAYHFGYHFDAATLSAGAHAVGTGIKSVTSAVDMKALSMGAFSTGIAVGAFLGRALGGAFQAGPLATILNAATSWFIQPTTEFVKIISSRYTAPLEQRINQFYDKLKPKAGDGQQEAKRNEAPNLATVERDGMDFAGMSPQEQESNWSKNLRMWVAVAKTFGQLLRDTHHAGRVLMMIAWHDEQATAMMVETMDSKLINLALESEARLTPYKSAILSDPTLDMTERKKKLTEFQEHFEQYQNLNERMWMDLSLDENGRHKIAQQIEEHLHQLAQVMTQKDIIKLASIQTQRYGAVRTLVTALALGEVRSFNTAEANRNLEPEARQAQRAIRNGFHMQEYVNKYRDHVQVAMEKMGYENARKKGPSNNCEAIFALGH
ncbi:MAG TPA: hypothetical protein VIG33_16880 [Pseudobdellovibrionaceae bacterium]